MSNYRVIYSDELYHHGIKGMKWGIRRFQNEDGSLTGAGRQRYGSLEGNVRRTNAKILGTISKSSRTISGMNKYAKNDSIKRGNKVRSKIFGMNEKYYSRISQKTKSAQEKQLKKADAADKRTPEEKRKALLKTAAVAAAAGLAVYGAYKLNQRNKLDRAEMNRINDAISDGKDMVDSLYFGFGEGSGRQKNKVYTKTVTYLGNDLKNHTAEATNIHGNRIYFNSAPETQKTFNSLKEFRKARKKYRNR